MAAMDDDPTDLMEDDEDELELNVSTTGGSISNAKTTGAGSSGFSANVSSSSTGGGESKKKHYFYKELRCMMYGFGDDKVPYTETVELLEEVVVEFVRRFIIQSIEIGKTGKLQLEDIWYLIRRDPKKYAKVKDLLTMNEELRRARKAFDEAKY